MSLAESENGTRPRTPRSHRAQRRRGSATGRRRWPIVTTALVVLLAVIVGGGYIFWRVSQNQYYVGADKQGQVVIYRGLNERIAWINLSSPYHVTSLTLAELPSNDRQTVTTAYASGSLTQVQQIVDNIRSAVNQCKQQYAALQTWASAMDRYKADVAQAARNHKPTNIKPPTQPPSAGATCPSSQVFGIPPSSLSPTTTPGHS